jgi:hypothetical protein
MTAVLGEHPGHGGVEELGQGAGEHGADAQAGDGAAALGAIWVRPPRRMAKEPKLTNPQRAKVTTATVMSESSSTRGPKSVKATNSLRISFSSRNEPAVTASDQGTPMTKATRAKA